MMSLRKFTRAEKAKVLSPEQHQTVEAQLHRLGATSVSDLSAAERESLEVDVAISQDSC